MLGFLFLLQALCYPTVIALNGIKTFRNASSISAATNLFSRDLFNRQSSDCYWDCGNGSCCPSDETCCEGGCAPAGSICCIEDTYCDPDETCNSLCGCLESGWACCGDAGTRYQTDGECCTTTGYWCEAGTKCLSTCDPDTGEDCCSGLQPISYSIAVPTYSGLPSLPPPSLPSHHSTGSHSASSSYHLHTRSTTLTQGTAATSGPAGTGIAGKAYKGPAEWWMAIFAVACGALAMVL